MAIRRVVIHQVPSTFTAQAARELVHTLNSDPLDDWTYEIESRGDVEGAHGYRVLARDEDGHEVGFL